MTTGKQDGRIGRPRDELGRLLPHRTAWPDFITRIRSRVVVEPDGCWIYTGCLTPAGYGRATFQYRQHYVHRVLYTHLRGAIPQGLTLDHLCRVRACCNPDHLEPVTHAENCRRATPFRTSARSAA